MVSELLTIDETAARLRVSRRTVYRLMAEGRIRATKVRGSTFVSQLALDRYVAASERGPRRVA